MIWKTPAAFHALWALPLLLWLIRRAFSLRARSLASFAGPKAGGRPEMRALRRRRLVRSILAMAGFACLVVALARPSWDPKPVQVLRRGRDVVFLLDVSRSMLAEDLAPNRLERAKLAIKDALEVLEGRRVGLVAFAGSTVIKCPLTLDRAFFRLTLEELGPQDISRGGTLIGDAIRKAVEEVFDAEDGGERDIVLISDGDDQESFPVQAARAAGEGGVRIIAIGLGDDVKGAPIPIADGRFVEYQGERVMSTLDPKTLRAVAEASKQGLYLHVATGNLKLDEVFAGLIKDDRAGAVDEGERVEYQDKFPIFLWLAFLFLLARGLTPGGALT